jgi:hypothetical protein
LWGFSSGSPPKKGDFLPLFVAGWAKEEAKKIGKILASARKALHNRKKKRVLCNMSGWFLVEVTIIPDEDS